MNKRTIHLSVNKPCSKEWKEMTPTGTGRFCNACDKEVTDFTTMSDEQLISFFAKKAEGEHPCGHFREDQLDKVISLPERPKKFKLVRLAASFLLAQVLLYQGKAFGKIKPEIEAVSITDAPAEGNRTINGCLVDYHSNKPISGVKIYVDSTELYSITDKEGKFSIKVPGTIWGEIKLLTEYISQESYVAGSVIFVKKGSVEELSSTNQMLYRYPEEQLEELVIIDFKVPLISGRYLSGAPIRIVEVKKETFWQRITKVFRRK